MSIRNSCGVLSGVYFIPRILPAHGSMPNLPGSIVEQAGMLLAFMDV